VTDERLAAIEAALRQMLLDQKRTDANCQTLMANQLALVEGLNRLGMRVASIEDEIEFVEVPVNQREAH
jgi:hypothetical protein